MSSQYKSKITCSENYSQGNSRDNANAEVYKYFTETEQAKLVLGVQLPALKVSTF